LIEIKNLYYSYPNSDYVLKDISLVINKGEFVSLLGANGSGKSTLALCIAGLLEPIKGKIFIDGTETVSKDIRKKVGILFQNPDSQILTSSVERELAFTLENLNIPYDEMHNKVEHYIKMFNLEKYKRKIPENLSGGEKQKIALASVLIAEPEYIILDEPASLLSPKMRKEILDIIKNFHKNKNITVVFITQMTEQTIDSSKIIIIENGKIKIIAKPDNILKREHYLKKSGIRPPILNLGGFL